MLRQKSLTMKEEKTEDKSRIQKGSHKLIEEEKAEIGNVSLQGALQIKAFSRITIVILFSIPVHVHQALSNILFVNYVIKI